MNHADRTRAPGPGAVALQALPTAATDPDRIAIVTDAGESLTYGRLAERASRLAAALRRRGLQEGDVVAVLGENDTSLLEIAWACRLAALYYVTVNSSLRAAEVSYLLNDSGAQALLASARSGTATQLTPELAPGVTHWLLRQGSHPGWDDYEAELASAAGFEADTGLEGALLQYSSGTTGRPKGIKHPLRPAPKTPAEDRLTFLVSLIGADGDSVYLCPAPLHHSAPQFWTLTMLRLGATVVLMKTFDAATALELIEKHRVTHGQFVPTMFARMLKLPPEQRLGYDVSSLRGVVHAAAPCPVEIKRQMLEWWGPIISEYWSSSEGAGFTFISAQEWLEHPGSVGRPLLGPLHICDPTGNELPAGQSGLIWAEGVEFSYLNDPAKNAETTSPQGWRCVGDIGRIDEDGYLYLTDRKNFMIISGGVNIYPQEAENALIEHPRVMDAAVLGLPDDDLGEIAVAVVQALEPADAGPELAAELTAWCEARLARYKCPRRILFRPELPRTDTGKLLKGRLRDELISQSRPDHDTAMKGQ
jgi:long-chain acyl-CoA synthetase